jgi:hypothetical protein
MDENINVHRVLIGNPECKRPLRNLSVDSSVILKQILENKVTGHALESFDLGQGQVAGCCKHLSATEHRLFKNLGTNSKFQMREG